MDQIRDISSILFGLTFIHLLLFACSAVAVWVVKWSLYCRKRNLIIAKSYAKSVVLCYVCHLMKICIYIIYFMKNNRSDWKICSVWAEATAPEGALQGVVVCHRLVGAASAGHQSVNVMNLLCMAMGNADAFDYSIRYFVMQLLMHCHKFYGSRYRRSRS
jgi:hypothetical protein